MLSIKKFLVTLSVLPSLLLYSPLAAATSGTIELVGTVSQSLNLTVAKGAANGFKDTFTEVELTAGMGSFESVGRLTVTSNVHYSITLTNLFFTNSANGATNIPYSVKLERSSAGGFSAVDATVTDGNAVNFNELNNGNSQGAIAVAVKTNPTAAPVAGTWNSTITVQLAAQ